MLARRLHVLWHAAVPRKPEDEMLTVQLNEHPEIARIVRAVAQRYNKRKAFFSVSETVALTGTYWDGGSRDTYTAVRLSDGFSLGAPQYAPPQFGGPARTPETTIPAGVAIIQTGIFCGKPATAHIWISPADAARLLPAPL